MGLLNASLLGGAFGGSGGGGGLESGMFGLLPMLLQQQGGGGMDPRTPGIAPPQAGAPQNGGMLGAFANNPQFQQQLQAMMQGQSPGFQGGQMQAPPTQMSLGPSTPGSTRNGNTYSLANRGQIDPLAFLRNGAL